MLEGNFYKVIDVEVSEDKILLEFQLNASHDIFSGHFPDLPIVPGVCQVQILKECVTTYIDYRLRLTEARDIKFLNSINPSVTDTLQMEVSYTKLENGTVKCSAIIEDRERSYFKSRVIFSE